MSFSAFNPKTQQVVTVFAVNFEDGAIYALLYNAKTKRWTTLPIEELEPYSVGVDHYFDKNGERINSK